MTLAISRDLDYSPDPGVFDEMAMADGQVRPAWSEWLSTLRSFSSRELQTRWRGVQALLRENGVTFNVNGLDDGLDRPWDLDPFPLMLTSREWSETERGLKQRVRLLESLLEDVYGEQRCLHEKWIPAPLLWANPRFQRSCHGLPNPPECRIWLHSVDLVRHESGKLLALRDRAETPGGCGYALENRLALTRMVPEFFQSQAIRKLGPFFRAMRDTLVEIAGRFGPEASVVFLTPGPASQTYFEQAYLSQYLGYSLVQGDDLTVRDNRVYLKLLEGLKPVDVIVRRVRDTHCDPLEIPTELNIGIPGLVQAVRAGNVVVANSLGCAFVETSALQSYLPRLCREYLGEDLLLQGVPTYWCGEPDKLDHVLNNLDDFAIKRAFSEKKEPTVFIASDRDCDRAQLRQNLLDDPESFVAQEIVQFSTAPSLGEDGLEPRRVLLRTFVARDGDEHCVMPGSLALVSADPTSTIASLDSGSRSKDTWILEHGESSNQKPRTDRKKSVPISRGGDGISSRTADNLFWLGRYLERAEGLCRVLRSCFSHLAKEPLAPGDSPLPSLLYFISPRWSTRDLTRERYSERLLDLLVKPHQMDGLRVSLDGLRRLTGVLRDRLSTESWTISNQLLEWSEEDPKTLTHALNIINRMLTGFSACSGMVAENMTRNHGWNFMDIGRRLERGAHTIALLRRCLTVQRGVEFELLDSILEITDTVRTYRRRYPGGLETAPVVDLLLADPSNPRSVLFQFDKLREHLEALPSRRGVQPLTEPERILIRCTSTIKLADMHSLVRPTRGGKRGELTRHLRELGKSLPEFSDHLARIYFSHLTLTSRGPSYGREVLP